MINHSFATIQKVKQHTYTARWRSRRNFSIFS